MITGIDIAGFRVDDPARAIAFYRDALGMVPTHLDEQGRGAEFELSDGSTFGVYHLPDAPPGAGVLLAVDDIYAAVTQYRAKGLEISDVTEGPICFMAFTQDPEGNRLIIHQRKTCPSYRSSTCRARAIAASRTPAGSTTSATSAQATA